MTSDDELLELEHRYVDAWFRFDEALVRELTLPDATWINQSGRLADFEESSTSTAHLRRGSTARKRPGCVCACTATRPS